MLEEGSEVLSYEVFVPGSCYIIRSRVVLGEQEEESEVVSCEVCVQGGFCIVSCRVVVGCRR